MERNHTAIAVEEGDVDRCRAIAHHHRERSRCAEGEEHATVARQARAAAEAALARRGIERELEREGLAPNREKDRLAGGDGRIVRGLAASEHPQGQQRRR